MDYLGIVLKGYYNLNNREHLSKYFFREFKKAEKEYYEADEFINGCLKVIEDFEDDLNRQLHEDKKNFYLGLNLAKQGLKGLEQGIPESELRKRYNSAENIGLTYEQLCQGTILECERALEEISIDDYSVNLSLVTHRRFDEWIPGEEVRYIKKAILEACEKNLPLDKLPKTFKVNCTTQQLNSIREGLIKAKIIDVISKNDFVYLFTEQPITKKMKRIEWKTFKTTAKYLLNRIVGEGFSNPIANKCFVLAENPKNKIFDSNVEITTSYPDIDNIFKQIK